MKLQNEDFNNFMFRKIFCGNYTQENELGGTCSTKGRDKILAQYFRRKARE
jgi:hypothetical protein